MTLWFLLIPQLWAEVSFSRDIQPLLSDRCFACHGPDGGTHGEKWKGGLRLDTKDGAFGDLVDAKHAVQNRQRAAKGLSPRPRPKGSRFAIVPGNIERSLLIERITSRDPDEQMPPPDSHLALSEAEKDLLTRWIEEGANWGKHWAFEMPRRPELPVVKAKAWPRTAVDHFVLARLEEKGIAPSPAAEPVAWLRRVSQDLSGLPPSLERIDSFLADGSSHARRRIVDLLLASDDFAERMTTIWLDNARYADSNGFQFDNARTMWPWRDWVINAYRSNMPYDQFVTEQLAGDLLPHPSEQQLIATGFNRNHGYSIEGGIIDEEYRVMYANDKTTTAGTLFLGLTFECTRCHDHKYDPLSMKDYYSFYAFFNTSAERGAPGEAGRKQKTAAPFLEVGGVRTMIMKETPRQSFILNQGLFDQPGEPVSVNTPAVLPSFAGFATNRLGLAQWLAAEENPLFARVAVNRMWQQFFGNGLVASPDNFGLQGAQPTHPQLLDWLAVEFRDSGWDVQHLIRTIVLSATYAQSSDRSAEEQDAENRWLARGSTFRLPAELIRDQALATGGLLSRTIGGPSVKPHQPNGVWEDLNAPKSHAEVYVADGGESRYRKSLYTYWRRAVPHPAMAAFDAPTRDVCTVERESTNTPLQALVTLHGPTYLDASRTLAERLVSRPDPVRLAFRTILSREPNDAEVDLLQDLLSRRKAHDASSKDPAAVAALADVCHVLLNLSEALTRK